MGNLGRAGEHNNTKIIFALTPELAKCDFLTAEVSTAAGEKVPIEGIYDEENSTFAIFLTNQLTVEGAISLQLVGYVTESETAEPQIIAKSPVVNGFITQGINGVETEADSNPNLLARIWAKVREWADKIHTHDNKKTLDQLYCKALEDMFSQGDDDGYLRFRGDKLRPVSDGVVIKEVEEIEKDGAKFLRLLLNKGGGLSNNWLPDFVDIPVNAVKEVEEEKPGFDFTLNGRELELPTGTGGGNGDLTDYYTKQEIDNKGFITAEDIPESGVSSLSYDNHLRVQWHRGYVLDAPEHTMASFVSTVKHGCKYIEVDLQFTKDNVIVLLHDTTIDRTSNGSGSINNLTLAEARQYDFGSWFNTKFAGEKIPTLEEFIKFCKSTGLYPYLEVKGAVPFTEEHLKNIVDTVNKNGMRGKVTYVSINLSHLTTIKNYDPEARLELSSYGITETLMTNANSLKTDKNEVSIDCNFADITDEGVNLCIANNIPLVAWVVDTEEQLLSMNPYISEIITNKLDANKVLYENAMSYEIGGGDEPTNPDVPDEPDEPTDDGFIEWENDTIVLTADDIWYNRNIINQSPYTKNETGKAIAKEFAIPIDSTYKITVSMESTYDAPLWGWTFFNQTVYNNYLSNSDYSRTNCSLNSVWEENNATVAVPETINSLPTIGVRLNFLLNRSQPSIDSTNFSKVTITRTKIVNE